MILRPYGFFMDQRVTLSQKIAVIDDDVTVLDAVKIVLDNQQWDIFIYTSGESFLNDVSNNQPDCLILDAHLSGLNGPDVIRSIVSSHSYIPIIVLTAYPNSPLISEMMKNGAEDLLIKPISSEVLVEHIERALSRLNLKRSNLIV